MLKIKIRGLKEELEARIYIFVKVEYSFMGGKLNMGKKKQAKQQNSIRWKCLCRNKEISYFHSK